MITAKVVSIEKDFQMIALESTEASYSVNAIADQAIPAISGLDLDGSKGIIISHRGTTWMNVSVALFLKNKHTFIALYDPKQGGAVICFSIARDKAVGQILSVPNL